LRTSHEGVQIDGRVLHAEGVGETLQFGDALQQRQLSTLETVRNLSAGLLTLGAASGCLATLATNAATDNLLAVRGAFGRLEIVQLH
jgi:hypothetical protein